MKTSFARIITTSNWRTCRVLVIHKKNVISVFLMLKCEKHLSASSIGNECYIRAPFTDNISVRYNQQNPFAEKETGSFIIYRSTYSILFVVLRSIRLSKVHNIILLSDIFDRSIFFVHMYVRYTCFCYLCENRYQVWCDFIYKYIKKINFANKLKIFIEPFKWSLSIFYLINISHINISINFWFERERIV